MTTQPPRLTTCFACGKPITSYRILERNYCNRECTNVGRKRLMDDALPFVLEHMETMRDKDMAANLGLSKDAFAYRMRRWRERGLLDKYVAPVEEKQETHFFTIPSYPELMLVG